MALNPDRVTRLAGELLRALGRLKELAALPQERFLADPDKVGSAKYHFVVASEAAIDLANHAIAQRRLRAPEDYADTFRVLGEAGWFDAEFTDALVKMARFRNRLVHLYWDVDDREVHRLLNERLGDLERFLAEFGRAAGLSVAPEEPAG